MFRKKLMIFPKDLEQLIIIASLAGFEMSMLPSPNYIQSTTFAYKNLFGSEIMEMESP